MALQSVLGSHLNFGSNFLGFFTKPNKTGVCGLPWTSGTKVWHFWANSDPPGGPRVPFQIWQEIQFFKTFLQTPTILVSMDFPWIPATRNKHFWAASDPPGDPRVPFQIWREIQFFCGFTKPNNMNVFGPPWTSATKASHFWADSNPPEGPRVPFQIWREIQFFLISSQNQTKWVSTDSPRPCQPRFKILELT